MIVLIGLTIVDKWYKCWRFAVFGLWVKFNEKIIVIDMIQYGLRQVKFNAIEQNQTNCDER